MKKTTPRCFVKGTKVHTKGGFKAIDKIRVGDHVWSENPETNEKALKKVKKIFVREKDSIIRLSINGEVIKTTDEHPFYKEGYGFVPAASLEVGNQIRTEDGISEIEEVEEIHPDKPIKVYNIEVEDYHTYYVSKQKVLVHNTCQVSVKNTSKITKAQRRATLEQNKMKGAAFEKERFTEFKANFSKAETQLTIKIGDTRTRLDAIGFDKNGNLILQEYKSSATAPLTRNQEKIIKKLNNEDAYVVGRGKGEIFTRGFRIPAGTRIEVIRPN